VATLNERKRKDYRKILSRDGVTIDGFWIGNLIY
jgi:hypothetical protein